MEPGGRGPMVFLCLFFIILTQRKITDRTRQDDNMTDTNLTLDTFSSLTSLFFLGGRGLIHIYK